MIPRHVFYLARRLCCILTPVTQLPNLVAVRAGDEALFGNDNKGANKHRRLARLVGRNSFERHKSSAQYSRHIYRSGEVRKPLLSPQTPDHDSHGSTCNVISISK